MIRGWACGRVGRFVRTWANDFFVHVGTWHPCSFLAIVVFCPPLYRPRPGILQRTTVHITNERQPCLHTNKIQTYRDIYTTIQSY